MIMRYVMHYVRNFLRPTDVTSSGLHSYKLTMSAGTDHSSIHDET